jgi:hypothetical protein
MDMDNSISPDGTFFFDQCNPPVRSFFIGHAFCGPDVIIDQHGLALFKSKYRRDLPSAQDGSYVKCDVLENQSTIEVDYCGNQRIFIYKKYDRWAVSNSLLRLAKEVQKNGWHLSCRADYILCWKMKGPLFNQPISYKSIFNEIELLPADSVMMIVDNQLFCQKRANSAKYSTNYVDSLSNFINIWLSRVLTILSDERTIVNFDLSGGLDSRTVFAFLAAAVKYHIPLSQIGERLRINTSNEPLLARDREVANLILREVGLVRNCPHESKGRNGGFHGAPESIEIWKATALAQYYPFKRIPRYKNDPLDFRFGGGGGENFRRFYKENSFFELPKKVDFSAREYFGYSSILGDFNEVCDTLETGSKGWPISILHYRHFRARFHAGSRSQRRTTVHPLNSSELFEVSGHLEFADMENRKLYFDIIANLCPELLDIEFDDPAKAPSKETRNRIKITDSGDVAPGCIFSEDFGSAGSSAFRDEEVFELLYQRINRFPLSYYKGWLKDHDLSDALQQCQIGRRQGMLSRQRDARCIHFALMLQELSDLGTLTRFPSSAKQLLRRFIASAE